jgi:CRISPR-associated protein Cmr6
MPEKPILKTQPQKRDSLSPPSPVRSLKQNQPPKSSIKIDEGDAKDVPLMFQAQIEDRGNIQYVGDNSNNEPPKYEQWVNQWLEGCPPRSTPGNENIQDSQSQMAKALQTMFQAAGTNTKSTLKAKSAADDADGRSWCYTIRWRMVTNGGQDEGIIRPVIGAKGMPFFPGSSMKGAFRRVCPQEQLQYYCGGEEEMPKGEKRTRPGILRFHGGYPANMNWAQSNRLVDIAHGQQSYQVMQSKKERGENANVQISLYQPEFKFGISSTQSLSESEWLKIKGIWEKALGGGIGSRVSAGYGYVNEVQPETEHVLFSVQLNGEGLMSQLLLKQTRGDKYKTPEFRPNMFKATLRGHTLRLLGGITDENLAKALTRQIWGGIPEQGEKGDAVVGKVGIHFAVDGKLSEGKHTYEQVNKYDKLVTIEMPTYSLKNGRLELLLMSDVSPELKKFLKGLIQFSLLLGGFGKSWRRIHHGKFHKGYFSERKKPMIGCHWDFFAKPQDLKLIEVPDLEQVSSFIEALRSDAIAWISTQLSTALPTDVYAKDWREAWHPEKVQVWGRVAEDSTSLAVKWFHDTARLKDTPLAGKMGQIGRIWHRMYPVENGYIELLTIFPDDSKQTQNFMAFLNNESNFELRWGDNLAQ